MNEQAKVIPLPQYEECDCDNGMRLYPAIYIDGDLYRDAEIMECDVCGGSSKIKIQEEE